METCPFCGIPTQIPHETQEGCIAALQAEIARVRAVLDQVHSAVVPGPAAEEDVEDVEGQTRL